MKKKIIRILFIILLAIAIVFCTCKIANKNKDNSEEVVNVEEIESVVENIEKEINEEDLEQGFLEEPDELISGASRTAKDDNFTIGEKQPTIVYFSQTDSRWKNKIYSNHGDPSQTMGSSACGPTSAAMVVSGIKGLVYPDQMADLYLKYGYRSYSDGTYLSAFQFTADYFDMEFKRVYSVNDAIDALRNNYYVISSCSSGLFTTGGHFIVLYGMDGDNIKIYDPYLYNGKFDTSSRRGKVTQSGNTVYCSISNFKNYANSKSWFCFKHNNTKNPQPTPVTPVTPQPTPVTPTPSVGETTGIVKVNTSLNVRRGPGTNYSYVKSLYNGNQVVIYEITNGWYRIGDNQWVIDDYVVLNKDIQINDTVGQTKKFKQNTTLYSNPNLTGTQYNYLKNTSVVIKENVTDVIDKVYIPATGRTAYVSTSAYTEQTVQPQIKSTIGQTKYFKQNTIIYKNSNLTGTQYNYLPNTKVIIKGNISNTIDYIYVPKTGRYGYVSTSVYR